MVSLAYTEKIDGKLLFKMISRQGRLRNNASHSGKRETAGCQSIDRGLSSQRPVNCVYFFYFFLGTERIYFVNSTLCGHGDLTQMCQVL